MSSFIAVTQHPDTGEFESAYWLDDYFGHHHYGVQFQDGKVFDPEVIKLVRNDMPNDITWEQYKPKGKDTNEDSVRQENKGPSHTS